MMLYEFIEKIDSLKDEAVIEGFQKILKEISSRVKNADDVRCLLDSSFGDLLASMEEDDVFGTEGMRL